MSVSVVADSNREPGVGTAPAGLGAVSSGDGAGSARVIGVDVTRGMALMGMFAVHIFETLHDDDTPSKTHMVMSGHALATFVLLAGVSITFITKRSGGGSWLTDRPTAAGLATRALILVLLGMLLTSVLGPESDVILAYYGLMFLFAIPLLRLPSRVLVGISIGLVLIAPLLVLASFNTGLPDEEPGLAALAHPVQVFVPLLVTGDYPLVNYMALICVGMVIGRLDLSNARVGIGLTVGGVVLAASSWLLSTLLLFKLGGLEHLRAAAPPRVSAEAAQNIILWEPDDVYSWWWLVGRSAYTTTPFRMVHDIGFAMAWLGLCLLITRSLRGRWALSPLAAAGAMSLTLYTAQAIVLESSFLEDHPIQLFFTMVYVALSFALLWRQGGRRGPLEALVTGASRRARRFAESHPRSSP